MRVIFNNIDSFLTCRKNKIIEKMKEKKAGNTTLEVIIWVCIAIILVAIAYAAIKSIFGGTKTLTTETSTSLLNDLKTETATKANP